MTASEASPRPPSRGTTTGSGGRSVDVGEDGGTPVVEDHVIPAPYRFTGKSAKVTVELGDMKPAVKAATAVSAEAAAKKAISYWVNAQPGRRA
jgi:hypothetical protein